MFTAQNRVRMHDTDMAGILYFARQFRFAHDALEDFLESEGLTFDRLFHQESFVFVIVHCEADYYTSVKVGDRLDIYVYIEQIGNSSFTVVYEIYRSDKTQIGRAKTVHVTLERLSRKKILIPDSLKEIFKKHLL